MKTGGWGSPWVPLESPKPPAVDSAERGEVLAAHQLDNDTAHRLSADGAAPPSSPCASASSDRIGTTEGSAP